MGKQVADNTEIQYTVTIKISDDGRFYLDFKDRPERGLVKSEYVPVGMSLVFPKKWGKTKGALKLVQTHIDSQEKIIEQAKVNLEGLTTLKKGIEDIGFD